MNRPMKYFLFGFVLIQAIQLSLAAIEIVSRNKRTVQSSTSYRRGTSDKAVDGNYNSMDLEQCATLLDPRTTSSSQYYATWEVDLGSLYAIVSVTIYNTAVLPEGSFTYDTSICAKHRNDTYNTSTCVGIPDFYDDRYDRYYRWPYYYDTSERYSLPPGGNVTVHFNQLVVADIITIRRTGFLTLCEVDVLGTRVVLTPEENASIRRTAVQSGTVSGRIADYAVDGNIRTTDLSRCASAFNSLKPGHDFPAWWQVHLGDFYLVKAITVYFPTVFPDTLFAVSFKALISFNDSLPSSYSYSGPGTCYSSSNSVPSSRISTLDCTYGRYMQTVGRYVTIITRGNWLLVLTICEVTVNGVRQNIAADDPAFAVFAPKRDPGLAENTSTPIGIENNTQETAKDSKAQLLAIVAIVLAAVSIILCIILIIVIIKMKGQMKENANKRGTNPYQKDVGKDPEQQPQPYLQLREPSAPVYRKPVADDDADTYEYVGETDLRSSGRP